MQLFSADAKLFYFDHKKFKNHPQKLLRNTQKNFQPCTAKRPKKKNSVFKMWLKESLSIALGEIRYILENVLTYRSRLQNWGFFGLKIQLWRASEAAKNKVRIFSEF